MAVFFSLHVTRALSPYIIATPTIDPSRILTLALTTQAKSTIRTTTLVLYKDGGWSQVSFEKVV
jgi:hypothetical protein